MFEIIENSNALALYFRFHATLPPQFRRLLAVVLHLFLLQTTIMYVYQLFMDFFLKHALLLPHSLFLLSYCHHAVCLVSTVTEHLFLEIFLPAQQKRIIAFLDLHQPRGTLWRDDNSRFRLYWISCFRRVLNYY